MALSVPSSIVGDRLADRRYLSTCVGLASDRAMIASVDDPVARYVPCDWFGDAHNALIT